MTRLLPTLALTAAALLGAAPALAAAKADSADEPYTDAQFEDDCELAGGSPALSETLAICGFKDGRDIICDRAGGEISNCELTSAKVRPPRWPGVPHLSPAPVMGPALR